MTLDQIKEHPRIPPVMNRRKTDPLRKRNRHPPHPALQNLSHRPADTEIKLIGRCRRDTPGLNPFHMLKHRPILFFGVINPDRKHPVHHLIIPHTLYPCEPPDTALRNRADPELPVTGQRAVDDRCPKVRSR